PSLDLGSDLDFNLEPQAPAAASAAAVESKFAQEPISQPTPMSTTKPSIGTPSELHFVDGLDNTGVTLNLAKRYLDLGEYDSAKRLLNEVIEVGNSDQKQEAKALIAQLS
ncbi:MAG: FimV/HubP family polar landmark protein, partial [Moraxella sp.]|uniref:FimV/HubP family polar landmark protein n=1 Tax=Moraxella sp. TaxID=479 RepID=UPI0026DD0D4E